MAHTHINRKEYWMVFGALFALTILEVGVVYLGVPKTPLFISLTGLAIVKATLVGLFFMHLKHETKILRRSVAIPMSIPAFYALILIAEGAWRRLPW
jgi:caa(3)-type oxidase subunit IV